MHVKVFHIIEGIFNQLICITKIHTRRGHLRALKYTFLLAYQVNLSRLFFNGTISSTT